MKAQALHAYAAGDTDEAWSAFSAPRRDVEPYDYCSRDGASALKAKIEAYWRERGQHVMLSMHNVGFHPAIRAARFDLRSDMVNGMPRRGETPAPKPVAAEHFAAAEHKSDEDYFDIED